MSYNIGRGESMEGRNIFPKVFMWMFIGLLISFGTGLFVSTQEAMIMNLYAKDIIYFVWIAELILVIVLSCGINKFNSMIAKTLFLLYALATGFSLSSVFIVYQLSSIVLVFAETALIFGVFALIGAYTKVDLSKIGTICYMGLFGIIIATLVNFFIGNGTADIMIHSIGILIFVGITAYDMQKIKLLTVNIENEDKAAIIGALELYLDFINIFLKLIQLFGKERD